VRNLRFTQSILEALSNVSLISQSTKLVPGLDDELGGTVVPALKIEKFNFTGATAAA
jgi:predicted Zn-dependent protease